jgi:hypothetical protein
MNGTPVVATGVGAKLSGFIPRQNRQPPAWHGASLPFSNRAHSNRYGGRKHHCSEC